MNGRMGHMSATPFIRSVTGQADDSAQKRILLIDDDADLLEALDQILRSAGYDVVATTHGQDIFKLLDLLRPDVIVTDVIMAEIDTIDAIASLRQSHPFIKIIAISGNPHLLTVASKSGAHHVLAKPFRGHQLSHLVQTALQ
jgi:DNA-binding NtrC family response regulator